MVEALKTTGEENQVSKRRNFLKVLKDTLAVTGEEKEPKKEPKTNEGQNYFSEDIGFNLKVPYSIDDIISGVNACISEADIINIEDVLDEFPEEERDIYSEKYIKNYKKLLGWIIKRLEANNLPENHKRELKKIIEDAELKKEIKPDELSTFLEFLSSVYFSGDDIIKACVEESDNETLNAILKN